MFPDACGSFPGRYRFILGRFRFVSGHSRKRFIGYRARLKLTTRDLQEIIPGLFHLQFIRGNFGLFFGHFRFIRGQIRFIPINSS